MQSSCSATALHSDAIAEGHWTVIFEVSWTNTFATEVVLAIERAV